MKKKIICCFVAFSMIITMSVPCFADVVDEEAEYLADLATEYSEEDEIIDDFSDDEGNYLFECDDSEVAVPVDGKDLIDIDFEASDEEDISIGLPEEVEGTEGIVTDNGTVVYDPEDEEMAVEVQVLEQEEDGISFDSVKQMITIESEAAPHEYGFEYELPEGYRLVKAEEYYKEESVNPYPGWVFIVNENSRLLTEEEVEGIDECGLDEIEEEIELPGMAEIVMFIEPAWAKDAEGNDVNTYYDIESNVLKQYVDFDSNSLFPIVADPTSDKPASKWLYSHTDLYDVTPDVIKYYLGGFSVSGLIKSYRQHKKAVDEAKTEVAKKEAEKLLEKDIKLANKAVKKAAKKVAKSGSSAVFSTGITLAINGAGLAVTTYMLKKGYSNLSVRLKLGLYRTYLKQGPHSGWEPWDYYKVVYKGKSWG